MSDLQNNKFLLTLIVMALLLSACGKASQTQEQISTAVAQTVQAQNSLTKIASAPTLTPSPLIENTAMPLPGPTNTSAPISGAPGCTVSARLAAENPPDAALLKPSQFFWKTWSLENTGTCTWDSTYKLVYWSGDLMGGLNSYPLPELVAPGETKDISIYLKTPDAEGTFTGYWSIQTPWNTYFGAGATADPFYVQVVVSNAAKLQFGITSVTYSIDRNPATGCPTNVRYTVNATLTTNGPLSLGYYWDQSDGNRSANNTLRFTEAGSKTISREWMVGKGDSPNPRWMQIVVTSPDLQKYDQAVFLNNCP